MSASLEAGPFDEEAARRRSRPRRRVSRYRPRGRARAAARAPAAGWRSHACDPELRAGRPALARAGSRRVPHAQPGRPLEPLAALERRGRAARSRQPRVAGDARLARRRAAVDGRLERDPVPLSRPGLSRARLPRPQPAATGGWEAARAGRRAADRHARRLACRRVDPPRGAVLRGRDPPGDRPPHGRLELVFEVPVGLDRAGDRALPRAGQRLERHRLQLLGRQVRPDLRGSLRRDHEAGGRRPRAGVQQRLGRDLGDRRLHLDLDHAGRAGRARLADRLAARPRARRPALEGGARLGREPTLRGGHGDHLERDLGSPRRLPDQLPRREPLRAVALAAHGGLEDGAAEALRAGRGGHARRAGPLHRTALQRRRVDGDGARRRRRDRGERDRHRDKGRLDLGRDRRRRAALRVVDHRGADAPGDRLDRQRAGAARAAEAEARAGDRLAERRRARRRGEGHLRALGGGDRHRRASPTRSTGRWRRSSPAPAPPASRS